MRYLLATYKSFDIVDCSLRVAGCLVLGCVSNETFFLGERNIRRCDSVSLIICDDLDVAAFVDADTGVRCAKINTNHCGWLLRFLSQNTECTQTYSKRCKQITSSTSDSADGLFDVSQRSNSVSPAKHSTCRALTILFSLLQRECFLRLFLQAMQILRQIAMLVNRTRAQSVS